MKITVALLCFFVLSSAVFAGENLTRSEISLMNRMGVRIALEGETPCL